MLNKARCLIVLLAAMSGTSATGQTSDDAYIHRRMADAGFISLPEMSFGGRDVRRVLLIDPYGFLEIPGVEVERHASGRYTLRTQSRGWTGDVHAVSKAEWNRLAALERAAFGPPERNSVQRRPGVVVHCWGGLIEASPNRAAIWSGCSNGTQAAQEYSAAMLTLAMDKAGCARSEEQLTERFMGCFADNGRLGDPDLQDEFQSLNDRWTGQREPGSDILMKARLDLRQARENPTPAAIARAQEAVLAFGRQQSLLRAILQDGFRRFATLDRAGGRDAALLSRTQRRWQQDIEAQNHNYIGLLEELARLSPIVPPDVN